MGVIKVFMNNNLEQTIYCSEKNKKKKIAETIQSLKRISAVCYIQVDSNAHKREDKRVVLCVDKDGIELARFESPKAAAKRMNVHVNRVYQSLSRNTWVKDKYNFKYI